MQRGPTEYGRRRSTQQHLWNDAPLESATNIIPVTLINYPAIYQSAVSYFEREQKSKG